MIKICSVAFLSLLLSASSLFAQTKTFAGADYSQGIVFVMENNQMVWKHKAPDSNDLWILPNGNILFTTGHGVLEMTRQNDTIFHYESKSPVFACQRLKNGWIRRQLYTTPIKWLVVMQVMSVVLEIKVLTLQSVHSGVIELMVLMHK